MCVNLMIKIKGLIVVSVKSCCVWIRIFLVLISKIIQTCNLGYILTSFININLRKTLPLFNQKVSCVRMCAVLCVLRRSTMVRVRPRMRRVRVRISFILGLWLWLGLGLGS